MPKPLKVAATKLLSETIKTHGTFKDKTIEADVLELLERLDKDLDIGEYAHSTGEGSVEEAVLQLQETITEYEESLVLDEEKVVESDVEEDDELPPEDEDDK